MLVFILWKTFLFKRNMIIDLKKKKLGREISKNINNIYYTKEKIIFKNYTSFHKKKRKSKIYKNYTGYPGGLKKIEYGYMYENNPKKVILKCIKGMLKKNKNSKRILSKIIFK
ncbi:50S ribosomal protein L13 [Candidatus Vidania fulgoroideae]|nr:50S ribosomal protein L13 [Candidatus Vidania fulgoroideae]